MSYIADKSTKKTRTVATLNNILMAYQLLHFLEDKCEVLRHVGTSFASYQNIK